MKGTEDKILSTTRGYIRKIMQTHDYIFFLICLLFLDLVMAFCLLLLFSICLS